MADPKKPTIDYSYVAFQQAQQDAPFPGTQLQNDLSNLKTGIDDTIDALKQVRRSDGAVQNLTIGFDQLKPELDGFGFNPPTDWITGKDYIARDTVFFENKFYRAVNSHRSGVFATDLAAGEWLLIVDFTASTAEAAASAAAALVSQNAAGASAIATAADRVQTGLDAAATAADRVQTGLDATATAADRVQTGLDAAATAADRVQTGLDVITADAAKDVALSAVPSAFPATRAAMKALDTLTFGNAFFDGSAWVWDGSDLAAEIGFMSVASTSVDAATGIVSKDSHGLNRRQAIFLKTAVNGLSANTMYYAHLRTVYNLGYTGGSGIFVVGATLTGGTSGATGTIYRVQNVGDYGAGHIGNVLLTGVTGTFAAGETITSGVITATAPGPQTPTHDYHSFKLSTSWANARDGVTITLTGTAAMTVYGHIDAVEAAYVIPTGKAFDGSQGAWKRVLANPGDYQMNWGGASGAVDIRYIFDSMKELAAGASLWFGGGVYATSDTLEYEARANQPLVIRGVSETKTRIRNASTDFVFKYFGTTGGGKEARGTLIGHMKLEKSGGGKCSGVQVGNLYRGVIEHIDADLCGQTGFHITGRGGGDQDATQGTLVTRCRARLCVIGLMIRGESPGSIICTETEINDNNFDANATTNLWIADCDKVAWRRNTLTNAGTGAGAVSTRGCVFIEYHGSHARNLVSEFNEYGNNYSGSTYIMAVQAVVGFNSIRDRFIRNDTEIATIGIYFGYYTVVGENHSINQVRITEPYVIAGSGGTGFTFVNASVAAGVTYAQPILVEDERFLQWNDASHNRANNNQTDVVYTRRGRDRRYLLDHVATTGGGAGATIALSTKDTLRHRVNITAGGGTYLTVSGEKHDGDVLTLEVQNSSGVATTATLFSGFYGMSPPIDTGMIHAAQFIYSAASGLWRQAGEWGRIA